MKDAGRKGRHASQVHKITGERCHNSKLTKEDVRQILKLRGTKTAKATGEIYGVSCGAVDSIWRGKNWKEIYNEQR